MKPISTILLVCLALPACKTTKQQSVRMVPAPAAGDVAAIVRGEMSRATQDGRRTVVYVGATWCEPCQRFHKAAAQGDLDRELPNLTFVEFDLDRDRDRLAAAGYHSSYIPSFTAPNADGTASTKHVEGSVKGDGAVANILPRLHEILAP